MFTKQMQHSKYFVNIKEHIMWKTPCDSKNHTTANISQQKTVSIKRENNKPKKLQK